MNQQLPPFSGDDAQCIKCSYVGAYTEYQPAIGSVVVIRVDRTERGPFPERLQRRCRRCDYAWDEALAPPAHDGPSIAECAADDAKHWNDKYAGERP